MNSTKQSSNHKQLDNKLIYLLFTLIVAMTVFAGIAKAEQPNILMITVDDMNWDSVGAFGNKIKDITPNIDSIANEGRRFNRAYVAASNCAPSRVAIQTGLYPPQSGARGFYYINDKQTPSISYLLKNAGFYTGVINKSTDTNATPNNDKYWDYRSGFAKVGKYSASEYGKKSKEFFSNAKKEGKPFYLVTNIADPHKPNFNDVKATKKGADVHKPSRIITESEVTIPDFLPELPEIRKDIRNYFNSVKRADDTVGYILRALKESGLEDNTLVIFLSDHGMPFPFAKSSVYDNGLRTPLVMKWPGKIQAGSVHENIVSVIDFFPTIMDVTNTPMPNQHNYLGTSILDDSFVKKGESRFAFGSFDENAIGYPVPMRGIITDEWNYVMNAWADGKHTIKSAAMNHVTYKALVKHAKKKNAFAKERVETYEARDREELCYLPKDPSCLVNLANDPKYAEVKKALQNELRLHLVRTEDYFIEAFDVREDDKKLQAFMDKQHAEAKVRAEKLRWKRGNNIAGGTKSNKGLYQPAI